LVHPEEFLPVAQDTGLITRLDTWILNRACQDAHRWRVAAPRRPLQIGVNVSARQLARREFATVIVAALEASGLEASQLALEITETELVEATPTALAATHQLRALGVHVGADDFGTGYSSLAHLKRFPVDFLKIDRSFVDGLPFDQDDTTIVDSVIRLGHALGLTVVAEGVETSEQLAQLMALGCDSYQGFLRSEPVAAGAIAALIREQPSLTG
jgi:EAL domain-containing protein (putative c-di-GMP-specific phosphodiesterase class I)